MCVGWPDSFVDPVLFQCVWTHMASEWSNYHSSGGYRFDPLHSGLDFFIFVEFMEEKGSVNTASKRAAVKDFRGDETAWFAPRVTMKAL